MGRSTVHYADNETNNILKRLHNKLRPAGTPVERVEYIIELLLLRIFEAKLKQDEIFSHMLLIRMNGVTINQRFLQLFLNTNAGQARILEKLGAQATKQVELGVANLESIKVPVPPIEVQHEIVEKLDRQMAALESVRFLKVEAKKRIEEILVRMWAEKTAGATLAATPPKNSVEEKPFLKRKVLATYIINQSLNDMHFGDVKFEKLFFLSEYFTIKRNFDQKYYVQAAGPYDNAFTIGYFKQITESKWFNRQLKGDQYVFSKGNNHEKSLNTYNLFSDDELERVNTLINYFKKSDYEQPEIIATLYAVWNNRIIKQEPVTDELLKEDFLNWDAQKVKYKDRLNKALSWMRENNFIPDGWGTVIEKASKKTKKKRN